MFTRRVFRLFLPALFVLPLAAAQADHCGAGKAVFPVKDALKGAGTSGLHHYCEDRQPIKVDDRPTVVQTSEQDDASEQCGSGNTGANVEALRIFEGVFACVVGGKADHDFEIPDDPLPFDGAWDELRPIFVNAGIILDTGSGGTALVDSIRRAGASGSRQPPRPGAGSAKARTNSWLNVSYGETEGWVAAWHVATTGDCDWTEDDAND